MNNVSIQGDIRYINYKFDPFTLPVFAAFAPITYVVPTIVVVIRITKVYFGCVMRKGKVDETMNLHVFSIIVLSQIQSFCYMLADYSTIRIPSTGMITAWCATQQPSHLLKVFFVFSVYFNYTSMLFPFLLSMLRLIPLYYPFNHDKLCARIVGISTPLILVYPLLFCFPLFPALGDCRQLKGTYQFGAVFIYYDRSLFNLKQANTLFLNIIFWFLVCTATNGVLYSKLRKLRKKTSVKFQKAELSLTWLTFSMLTAYVTNLGFVSFLYILADYSTIRIPSTGLVTSWCASQQPNHGLKVLYFLSVYFNYTALLFPFFLSILRVIPIYYPVRVEELTARTVRVCTPILFIYPFLFTFPLFPALGDCRQLLGAYPFGSIYVYWSHSWFDLKLSGFLLTNLIVWISACTVLNAIIYRKLEKLKHNINNKRIQKAELSLTLTTLSMLVAHITNLALVAVAIFYPSLSAYLLAIRPYGNDCDFVFVPWIFYLTHPIFKTEKVNPMIPPKENIQAEQVPTAA